VFDSFECAIHAIAPSCDHCGCKIIRPGIEAGASVFCCPHCAEVSGVEGARDRLEA
jgi:hypothetical protein